MGEFYNTLLRGLFGFLWVGAVLAGLYVGACGLTADVNRDIWETQGKKSWLKKTSWEETTWDVAWKPSAILSAWHLVRDNSIIQFRWPWQGQSLVRIPYMSSERFTNHFLSFVVGGVLLALLFEFMLFPFARSRLARWLSEDKKSSQNFGKARSLPRGNGFILSKKVRLDRSTSNRHVLTIGPSGSGKSRGHAFVTA